MTFLTRKTGIFASLLLASPLLFLPAIGCEVKVCEPDDEDCGVVDIEDDSDDDTEGSAGSAAGGAGDSQVQGGAGGMDNDSGDSALVLLDCHEEGVVSGRPGDTSPTVEMADEDYECQACAERLCADQLSDCYAEGPNSVCLYGTTTLMDDGGESSCMLDCFLDLEDDLSLSELDVSDCAARCGSNECDADQASSVTQDLMRCLLDTEGNDPDELGCVTECGLDVFLD